MSEYCIRVVDTLIQWKELSEAWNKLLHESSSCSIFLSWEWLFSWGETFLDRNRVPFILTVYEKDQLIGIAPWCINNIRRGPFRLRRVEFLGSPESGSDYLDVITKKNKEKQISICLYNFMFRDNRAKWDCLCFRDVPSNSSFYHNFLKEFDRHGKYVDIEKGSLCPVVILPGTREDYFNLQSKNRRQQFNKHLRKLEQEENIQYLITKDAEDGSLLDSFAGLYEKRWGRIDNKYKIFLSKFICMAKDAKYIRFDMVKTDARTVAMTLHLIYKDTLYNYLTIVDRNFRKDISVGNILNELSIESAIDDNFQKYDFLKGDEEYKFHWANFANRSLNVRYYQGNFVALGCFVLECLKRIGKVLIR